MTIDLATRYLGLELRSPIVASAAPHNNDPLVARRLERAGVGAIVLPSLFEEEILAEEIGLTGSLEQGAGVFAEALDYFPAIQSFAGAADRYVTSLQRVKASVTIPVIASLNGSTVGGWVGLARRLEDAGADALELNLYHIAADPRWSAPAMESRDLELIAAVRAATSIPLAVKLSPFYSAFANGDMAIAWWAHVGGLGAGAILVLFMRQKGVPLFAKALPDHPWRVAKQPVPPPAQQPPTEVEEPWT